MEDRIVPIILAETVSASELPGMTDMYFEKYKQHSAVLYDLLMRYIHQSLSATHRPFKHTSTNIVRSQPGNIVASLFIICSKFKKSSFVLRQKYAKIFSSAYQGGVHVACW